MEKSEYNNETLDICELIGCYFVDTFFNALYSSAKSEASKNSTTTTQEYKLAIISYTNAVNSDGRYYSQTIHSLLNWYRVNSNQMIASLEEFENKVVGEFVPKLFYIEMSKKEKDIILSEIITKAVNELGAFIAKPQHIKLVIDKRRDPESVRYIQNEMHTIMLTRHDIIQGKFIERNKSKKVDAHYVDKLKEALKKQLREKLQYKEESERAKKIAEKLQSDLNAMEEDYRGQIEGLENNINSKDDKIQTIKSAMEELVRDKSRLELESKKRATEVESLKLEKNELLRKISRLEDKLDSSDESSIDEDEEAANDAFEKRFAEKQQAKQPARPKPLEIVNKMIGDDETAYGASHDGILNIVDSIDPSKAPVVSNGFIIPPDNYQGDYGENN